MVDISNMSKARVLAELYNASKPLGLGMLNYDPTPMTEEEAQTYLDQGQAYFDYLKGRVMKVDLSTDELETYLYNRDNGDGAAEAVLAAIS